jgi:hypothetical protein
LQPFTLKLPEALQAVACTLRVILADHHHDLSNEWNVWVFPHPRLDPGEQIVALYDPGGEQVKWAALFPFIKRVDDAAISTAQALVATRMTEAVVRFLDSGGRVLWLERGGELNCRPYAMGPIVDYQATLVNDHPVTRVFPHEGWCDMQFHHLTGAAALDTGYFDGFTPIVEAFQVPYLLDHPRILPFRRKALLAEAQVEQGRLLATTFAFDRLGEYPEVDAMAGALLAYLLAPREQAAFNLRPDDLREWAWGSAHGEQATDFVPFVF